MTDDNQDNSYIDKGNPSPYGPTQIPETVEVQELRVCNWKDDVEKLMASNLKVSVQLEDNLPMLGRCMFTIIQERISIQFGLYSVTARRPGFHEMDLEESYNSDPIGAIVRLLQRMGCQL